jgi:hypothetical protein
LKIPIGLKVWPKELACRIQVLIVKGKDVDNDGITGKTDSFYSVKTVGFLKPIKRLGKKECEYPSGPEDKNPQLRGRIYGCNLIPCYSLI